MNVIITEGCIQSFYYLSPSYCRSRETQGHVVLSAKLFIAWTAVDTSNSGQALTRQTPLGAHEGGSKQTDTGGFAPLN